MFLANFHECIIIYVIGRTYSLLIKVQKKYNYFRRSGIRVVEGLTR